MLTALGGVVRALIAYAIARVLYYPRLIRCSLTLVRHLGGAQ